MRGWLAVLFVALPFRALAAQCPDGSPPPCRGARAPRLTVAVMPFDNLSRDSADNYLASGLTDEITERLAQVERFAITSAAVMRRFHAGDDPRRVATDVRASHLVTGSVRRERRRLRISVELIRARDGVVAWNRAFDQPDSTLLDLQALVAQSVAAAIAGRLLPGERTALAERPARDPRAYDHWLRGVYATGQRTTASLQRAIQEFDLAIGVDSAYGDAWAGMAHARFLLAGAYYDPSLGMSRDSADKRWRAEALHAVEVDSQSARAWLAAAVADTAHHRLRMERALALSPRDPLILTTLSAEAGNAGDTAAQFAYLRRAVDADPTSTVTLLQLGMLELYRRGYREAARWLDSAVSFHPEAPYFYSDRAHVRIPLGDTAGARADAAQTRRLGNDTAATAIEVLLAARSGDTATARAKASRLTAMIAPVRCRLNFNCIEVAVALAAIGDGEGAIALLSRIQAESPSMNPWLGFAEFDALRSDPRFARIRAAAESRGR